MATTDAYYVAFDPGKHCGGSMWDESGKPLGMWTTHSNEELNEKLESLPKTIKVVIYEDFILFPNKAKKQAGSRMPASQAIGYIQSWALRNGCELVKQPSNILEIGGKFVGIDTKSMDHVPDMLSAFIHGEYYLVKNHIKVVKL